MKKTGPAGLNVKLVTLSYRVGWAWDSFSNNDLVLLMMMMMSVS